MNPHEVPGPSDPPPRPVPLVVAAVLTALEGLFLLGYAVLELASLDPDRAAVAVTTSVFFAAYGGGLVLCAWSVTHAHSWARSPIVLAQLIQLLLAWSFRGEATALVAIVIGVVAVAVLVGLFHPASVDALADDPLDE